MPDNLNLEPWEWRVHQYEHAETDRNWRGLFFFFTNPASRMSIRGIIANVAHVKYLIERDLFIMHQKVGYL